MQIDNELVFVGDLFVGVQFPSGLIHRLLNQIMTAVVAVEMFMRLNFMGMLDLDLIGGGIVSP
jgi:hypothetical protein